MSTEEVVEEAVEAADKLVEAASAASADGLYVSKGYLAGAAFIGGLAIVGVGYAAYQMGVKRTQTKYEEILEKEVAEAKAFYSALHKKDDFATPEKTALALHGSELEEAAEALLRYQGEDEADDPEEEEGTMVAENVNVFLQNSVDDDFDFDQEMANRSPERPYIIHEQEFMEADPEFEKLSITYYAGDDTLADDGDEEIPLVDETVGEDNLQRFGHGSGDSRIVYIRNERLSTDFEVLKSDGKYAHEVLGLEHADGGARAHQRAKELRKFRDGDS